MNQRLPSGPAVIPCGRLSDAGIENSLIVPLGVIRPILLREHLGEPEVAVGARRDPAGADCSPWGSGTRVIVPLGVIRPILLAPILGEPEVAVRDPPRSRTGALPQSGSGTR